MKKIILASTSPRRKQLMGLLGIPFEVVISDFDENLVKIKNPTRLVEVLSLEKAKIVAKRYKKAIVIGADTVLVFKGQILGKPKDKEDARRMLKILSGTEHSIITGFTVFDTESKKSITKSVESKAKMKKLTSAEINAYIKTEEPMDKAGAYGIQERGGVFIEEIHGDFFNIVGLPMKDLRATLEKFGIITLK